ncbi:MAG: CPBP family intramembrane metalloprotease [Ruminococcus sp.]|nr:CPBP family intramembrane metalloprotease [Ruminococcus sp.]
MEDNKKYLIDIAKEKTYPNQFDDYHKEFSEWRTRKDNPYGYSFVHDVREHTYVDGEGYYQKKADAAEKAALTKCLGLLGASLLVMLFIDAVISFVFYKLYNDSSIFDVRYSEIENVTTFLSPLNAALFGAATTFKYIAGLWIFVHFSKIPRKVAIPLPKDAKVSKSGIYLILVIMVMGKVGSYLINIIFGWMNVDCVFTLGFHNPDSILSDAIYVFFNCVLVSIFSEFLFRGAILQLFRQFGDTYALIVSVITFSFTYYDVSSICYASLLAAVLGLFTLKTGSIKTAVIMRIVESISSYAVSCVILDNYSNGRVVIVCIYAFIATVAAFVFSRLMCNGKLDFRMRNDSSEIDNGAKLRLFVTNTSITLWLVAVLGMVVLMVRFI